MKRYRPREKRCPGGEPLDAGLLRYLRASPRKPIPATPVSPPVVPPAVLPPGAPLQPVAVTLSNPALTLSNTPLTLRKPGLLLRDPSRPRLSFSHGRTKAVVRLVRPEEVRVLRGPEPAAPQRASRSEPAVTGGRPPKGGSS